MHANVKQSGLGWGLQAALAGRFPLVLLCVLHTGVVYVIHSCVVSIYHSPNYGRRVADRYLPVLLCASCNQSKLYSF